MNELAIWLKFIAEVFKATLKFFSSRNLRRDNGEDSSKS